MQELGRVSQVHRRSQCIQPRVGRTERDFYLMVGRVSRSEPKSVRYGLLKDQVPLAVLKIDGPGTSQPSRGRGAVD